MWRFVFVAAVTAGSTLAQIGGLASSADGKLVYFSTDGSLRQRGSKQPFSPKMYCLRDRVLTLIEDAADVQKSVPVRYDRFVANSDGTVFAVNRSLVCYGKGACPGLPQHSTTIHTPAQTITFPGRAHLTMNGRFALITVQAAGVQLVDLASGKVTLVGSFEAGTAGTVASDGGHFVSEDGTVLIGVEGGVKLVGPSGSGVLRLAGFPIRAILAADASRVVYETMPSGVSVAASEVHVLDVKTAADRSLGPGRSLALTSDGRQFSFLRTEGTAKLAWFADTQVWLGDAITGNVRKLSDVSDKVEDQTIAGDGHVIIAATRTGRLLWIDATTGAVTQHLDSPGPSVLFTVAVPGSYNELVGEFVNGPPELLVRTTPAVILGRSPRGYAIQIPWDFPISSYSALVLRESEPQWERQLIGTVQDLFPIVLPVGPTGPDPPSGYLGAYSDHADFDYAIHEDWSEPVSRGSPARPGEVIHFYGTGWGPIDGVVATGQPTPGDRLYRLTLPCKWLALAGSSDPTSGTPFEVPFAGLAPGLIGVYQLDFRIPQDWREPVFSGFCIWPSGPNTFWAGTATISVRP
jgi:uncharacterized protein (TIGR03437 family)